MACSFYVFLTPKKYWVVAYLTSDPGVSRSISALSHTFVEIDHEINSTVILLLPMTQEGLLSITSKSMCTK